MRVKKYTAPASWADSSSCLPLMPVAALSSLGALTATVLPSPLIAMRTPNQSSLPGFEALRNTCWVQVVPFRTKTYAAPDDWFEAWSFSQPAGLMPGFRQSSSAAPDAMVLPSSLMASEYPSESWVSALSAWMRAWCDQTPPVRVSTYSAPFPRSASYSATASVLPFALSPDRVAEQHVRARHRRLDVRLLRPGRAGSGEDVLGAGLIRRVVGLVAVDAGGVAVFADRAHRQRVAVRAQRDGVAKLIAFGETVADAGGARVRRLDIGLLRPGGAGAGKDVDGAGLGNRAIVLVAVDPGRGAGLVVGRDRHRVAVAAQRDARPEIGAIARGLTP